MKNVKTLLMAVLAIWIPVLLGACSSNTASGEEQIVIQTNGDEEAVMAIKNALKEAGYEGKYVLQSLGTSELGGKLIAEGDQVEADIVTMSSYFLESAQTKHSMFIPLTFSSDPLETTADFYSPILAITGSIFVNTEVLKQKGLDMPESIKDLTAKEYEGLIAIPNIMDSSTGWLLIQAILSEYGEEEGKAILKGLIKNSGPHLESSGSGPIKKVQAGEAAAGFGLRHQAVEAKESGVPIEFIDPAEGNFSLAESLAVVKKDSDKTKLAMEMAEVIIKDAREELIKHYPVALYEGEKVAEKNEPAHPRKFEAPLTVELLQKHQDIFNSSK
ncbi:extracellular solute-binding protein [Cytobacillus pseudoceanisediminis]|uniref:extracellular solute-binding protein n=1 Tax=Cytobacillus pseudoceanisediminis TaxID=3051614 RepID=UPI003660E477